VASPSVVGEVARMTSRMGLGSSGWDGKMGSRGGMVWDVMPGEAGCRSFDSALRASLRMTDGEGYCCRRHDFQMRLVREQIHAEADEDG
jgi:hypothetical protein